MEQRYNFEMGRSIRNGKKTRMELLYDFDIYMKYKQ